MNKVYTRINWENYPSTKTELDAENLNTIDYAVNEMDNRIIEQDTSKANKTELSNLIKDWNMDESTGIITITKYNGSTIMFDLNIEKIPVSFSLSDDGILTMETDDGTKFTADIGSAIPILTFENSEEIAVETSGMGINKTYSFLIKNNSISEEKLQTNFLADIKVEVAKAQASALTASTAESNAEISEKNAKKSETASMASETAAAISENNAASSASESATRAENALSSAEIATSKANAAAVSESNAKESEQNASACATSASEYADIATGKALESSEHADMSKSYAVGTDGAVRENDNADNAKYFYEQVKQISQGLNGIIPIGTVAFADLPTSGMSHGWMYNISDEFISDERFNDGGGVYYGAGNNVIWTSDDLWDVTASSSVTGVKGNKETTYRQGNVNITPENIGAIPTSATCNKNWVYSGQAGQPSWLWGSNDGTNCYVWSPANFSVNYATSAGSATTATTANSAGYATSAGSATTANRATSAGYADSAGTAAAINVANEHSYRFTWDGTYLYIYIDNTLIFKLQGFATYYKYTDGYIAWQGM